MHARDPVGVAHLGAALRLRPGLALAPRVRRLRGRGRALRRRGRRGRRLRLCGPLRRRARLGAPPQLLARVGFCPQPLPLLHARSLVLHMFD